MWCENGNIEQGTQLGMIKAYITTEYTDGIPKALFFLKKLLNVKFRGPHHGCRDRAGPETCLL